MVFVVDLEALGFENGFMIMATNPSCKMVGHRRNYLEVRGWNQGGMCVRRRSAIGRDHNEGDNLLMNE